MWVLFALAALFALALPALWLVKRRNQRACPEGDLGGEHARIVFIRRYNATANLKNWFGTFGDELSPVDEQLVFDLKQYERLFRDSPELLARTPAKVEELSGQRTLTDAAKEVLAAAALRNSRIRNRLHAVVASGRLEHVGDARLEKAMVRFGPPTGSPSTTRT